MHLNIPITIGGALVGLLVGMTGAGGGALMTPMLTLIFGVAPAAAISSDLVAAVIMRPIGALVHLRAGTVNRRMVVLLAAGAVPAAFGGSCLLSLIGTAGAGIVLVERFLGGALLLGALAMALRALLDRRRGYDRGAAIQDLSPRPLLTVVIGAIGGVTVGMTSVGAGSLMIVLLLFANPSIGARQLVGTDLAQAVPMTLSAALGALIFGHVQFGLTGSLVLGAVPAVLAGAAISSRVSDRLIRPLVALVILASGLRYLGVGVGPLVWALAGAALVRGTLRARALRGSGHTRARGHETVLSSSGLD